MKVLPHTHLDLTFLPKVGDSEEVSIIYVERTEVQDVGNYICSALEASGGLSSALPPAAAAASSSGSITHGPHTVTLRRRAESPPYHLDNWKHNQDLLAMYPGRIEDRHWLVAYQQVRHGCCDMGCRFKYRDAYLLSILRLCMLPCAVIQLLTVSCIMRAHAGCKSILRAAGLFSLPPTTEFFWLSFRGPMSVPAAVLLLLQTGVKEFVMHLQPPLSGQKPNYGQARSAPGKGFGLEVKPGSVPAVSSVSTTAAVLAQDWSAQYPCSCGRD
jgi:hypothetical protein